MQKENLILEQGLIPHERITAKQQNQKNLASVDFYM